MKVTAINGSPRANGNTNFLLATLLAELDSRGVETELYQLAGRAIRGCTACFKCKHKQDGACHGPDNDFVNEILAKMVASDGIVLASPTYFADVSAEIKALIDRTGLVSRANGDLLRRKAGAAVVAVRRAGAVHALDTLNHFFTIGQMVIVGSSYWNLGMGGAAGEVAHDEEGLATMRTLGENMAWLLAKLAQ